MSVHPSFAAIDLNRRMGIDAEPTVVRIARFLGLGLTSAPLGRPDPIDGCHWYALWQGDAHPE